MGGYMPSTRSERAEMLRAIGLERPEELFASGILTQTFHTRLARVETGEGWRYYYD